MHRMFVIPQRRWADVVLESHRSGAKVGELAAVLRQRMG
jgi:hypothetical protein